MKTIRIRLNRKFINGDQIWKESISPDGTTIFGEGAKAQRRGKGLKFDQWYEATRVGNGFRILEHTYDDWGWRDDIFEIEEEVHKEKFDKLMDKVLE